MVKPITPDEIASEKTRNFPDFVLKVFNKLIAQKYSNGSAKIYQKDIIVEMLPYTTRSEIFDKNYLDIEDVYRKAGWSVSYDKPGYNETYEPSFEFKRKPR